MPRKDFFTGRPSPAMTRLETVGRVAATALPPRRKLGAGVLPARLKPYRIEKPRRSPARLRDVPRGRAGRRILET